MTPSKQIVFCKLKLWFGKKGLDMSEEILLFQLRFNRIKLLRRCYVIDPRSWLQPKYTQVRVRAIVRGFTFQSWRKEVKNGLNYIETEVLFTPDWCRYMVVRVTQVVSSVLICPATLLQQSNITSGLPTILSGNVTSRDAAEFISLFNW